MATIECAGSGVSVCRGRLAAVGIVPDITLKCLSGPFRIRFDGRAAEDGLEAGDPRGLMLPVGSAAETEAG